VIAPPQPPCAAEYDAFAPFYDAFTAASDYDVWTEHLLGLTRELGFRGRALLDLACGTGKSFLPFMERGFEVTGSDGSARMLAEAARKAPGVRLVHGDVRSLGTLGRFDLVTCIDDSLNYLLEDSDLAGAFRSMAANLAEDGVALFDLNTLLAYRTTFATDSVVERDGTFFAWRGESSSDAEPACRASALLEIFRARSEGLYERTSVHHRQRHHTCDRVRDLLGEAGLDCLGVYGVLDDGALTPDADELKQLKVLYAARPTKGGDAG
jgi:SAM-dependent methyltransferase